MRFGRVEGVVEPVAAGETAQLRLIVYLETGTRFDVVRDELISPFRPIHSAADLIWHADQLTQETIAVDLALQGWEVVGAGEVPPPEPRAPARSATYAVRNLGSGG